MTRANTLSGGHTIMRLKLIATTCLALTLALAGAHAAERRPGGGPALEVAAAAGCPVRILESKTFLASSLTRDPWAALRGAGTARGGRATYGPGESSLVFNLGFRNVSEQGVRAVGMLWQALDATGDVVYEWISIYSQTPVTPGDARTMHELNVEAPMEVASYRLSVIQVNLADGTVWSADR